MLRSDDDEGGSLTTYLPLGVVVNADDAGAAAAAATAAAAKINIIAPDCCDE